ncbi:MAG: DotU family type IV/VI secretion system protein [Phycisphaerales bacterium]
MTLLELCEPTFQYVCRLNRLARKGGNLGPEEVRAQVKALLADARAKAGQAPNLAAQFEKIELPLIFFCDSLIRESRLPFAGRWADLAAERNELAGDEKFFDLLEETLADRSEQATERLLVFYTCLGLGFTGWYNGQPEYLRKKMMEIAARLRGRGLDPDAGARLCADAYEHVNTANLIEPPGRSLVGMAIALVGLVVVLFITNAYLYRSSAGDLKTALDEVKGTLRSAPKEARP